MFGFKTKKADVLDHWIAFADNFQTSALDFYTGIEKELKERQVPGLDMTQVEFAEGGALSHKRIYLRMLRERLVFDVCAAQFGTGYFFSCRFAEIPAVVRLWQLLLLFLLVCFAFSVSLTFSLRLFGAAAFILCPLAWMVGLLFLILAMRNLVAMGLRNLDATLIKIPLIGPVYEAWIRKETYYRHDTRLMYLSVVGDVVKRHAEEVVAAKGIKLERQYEQAPILGELYKPVFPRVTADQNG